MCASAYVSVLLFAPWTCLSSTSERVLHAVWLLRKLLSTLPGVLNLLPLIIDCAAARRGSVAAGPLDPAAIQQLRDAEDRAALNEMHRRMSVGRRRLSHIPAVGACV
jgi:hypothetical protein